ncbi:MAG: S4 domain-containing protein, partial [Pseudomonadota bacterium]
MNSEKQTLTLPGTEEAGVRADKYLSTHERISSRTRAVKLIEHGLVQYDDGQPIKKPSEKL